MTDTPALPGTESGWASPAASAAAPDARTDFTPTSVREVAGQRDLAATRPGPRLPRTDSGPRSPYRGDRELRYRFARGLTDRDIAIVRLVAKLGVLTTDQVADAFFGGRKRAWERLSRLHSEELLDRFRPFAVTGSAPHHYVIGKRGAVLAAAHDPSHPHHQQPERAARAWRPGDALAMAGRARLAHTVGVNGVCTALLGHARRHPDTRLVRWLTEAEIARHYGQFHHQPVRPDAFFVWRQYGEDVDVFLEYDRGTERPAERLVAKLHGYEALESDRGRASWVLFAFTSHRREDNVRQQLAAHRDRLAVATATLLPGEPGPAEAIWRPLGSTRYVALVDLTLVPKPQAAVDRVGDRAWRDWLTRDLDTEDPPW